MDTQFSALLKARRNELNLLKKEVANMMGVTAMYYARYENNDMLPTRRNLKFFSEFLEISERELWEIIERDKESFTK